jgi:hypothetical protein
MPTRSPASHHSLTTSGKKHIDDRPSVAINGRAPTLELAKARFLKNWLKCREPADELP